MRVLWLVAAVLLLAGCVSPPPLPPAPAPAPPPPDAPPAPPPPETRPVLPHYRCDQGVEFDVRFGDGNAELVFANGDRETLLRDAGGTSPNHKVFSSTRMKAEFGAGDDGRGAALSMVSPPIQASCRRD